VWQGGVVNLVCGGGGLWEFHRIFGGAATCIFSSPHRVCLELHLRGWGWLGLGAVAGAKLDFWPAAVVQGTNPKPPK
jgi:hypothetical protein